MEAELTAVVASGATTVVDLMATDAWNAVRSRIVELLQRGDRAQEDTLHVENELELERREVIAAQDSGDGAALADIEAVWRTRLRRLLHDVPSAATALGDLIAETNPRSSVVRNTISDGNFHQPVIQAGSISGDLLTG
ncbi:hypothetical protein ACGFZQ_12890 [Streptomyces sp. NPDC048254]|uniref:hypothetical protein n=1 Tax=Streptomyces sp. NPDC048254 TaxID=3365525 RepID=UPI00371D009B